MDREVLFGKTLEKVRKLSKEQGNCISEEQVKEAFAPLFLDDGQLEMVYEYLRQHKIGIGEPVNMDDYLSDEERNYLEMYLDDLKQLPEEKEGERLAVSISAMAGEEAAKRRLTELYLPDVVEIAKLYTGQGVFLEDLIGEGNAALFQGTSLLGCLERSEEVQGMLGKMIMDAMEDFIAENTENARIDKKAEEKVNAVMEKAKELSEELRRKVTPQELSEETGLSEKAIRDAMRISGYRIEYLEDVRSDN